MTDNFNRDISIRLFDAAPDTLYFPDYAGRIELAYEAEEVLSAKGLQPAYERALLEVVERDAGGLGSATPFHLIHATARQRCEAMLEALKAGG